MKIRWNWRWVYWTDLVVGLIVYVECFYFLMADGQRWEYWGGILLGLLLVVLALWRLGLLRRPEVKGRVETKLDPQQQKRLKKLLKEHVRTLEQESRLLDRMLRTVRKIKEGLK